MPTLAHEWEAFYTIVGSSAAALIGLQFVVMALLGDLERPGTTNEVEAFGTPTVVHFSAALLVSAVMVAPWETLAGPAWSIGVVGLAGLAYGVVVVRRARRQTGYEPVLEDWIWHAALPILAHVGFMLAAASLERHPRPMLFGVAAMSLLLLFIGIHNAWDTVIYIAIEYGPERRRK